VGSASMNQQDLSGLLFLFAAQNVEVQIIPHI
jgi:hypothetical protein